MTAHSASNFAGTQNPSSVARDKEEWAIHNRASEGDMDWEKVFVGGVLRAIEYRDDIVS